MKYADYIERKRHGSLDFPIQHYFLDKDNPQYIMPPHWHNEFEIILVREGVLRIFLNAEEFILNKNDILLIMGGTLHIGIPENSVYECLVFDPGMLKTKASSKYIEPFLSGHAKVINLVDKKHTEIFDVVLDLFVEMKKKAQGYDLSVISDLFRLFSLFYKNGYILYTENQPRRVKMMAKLIDWIENNLSEQITLEKASEISGLSKKYLCRVFKEYTSKTFTQYVTELRIENACFEITTKKKSVTEAALDNGFCDPSYFCKQFKKYKGMSPKEYKDRHKL